MCTLQIVYFLFFFPFRKILHVNVNFFNWWMDYNNMTDFILLFFLFEIFFSPLSFQFLSVCNAILNNYEGGEKTKKHTKKLNWNFQRILDFSFIQFRNHFTYLLLLSDEQLHSHERKCVLRYFFVCVYLFFSPRGR